MNSLAQKVQARLIDLSNFQEQISINIENTMSQKEINETKDWVTVAVGGSTESFIAPCVTRYRLLAEEGFTRCKCRAVGQPVNRAINSATSELCRACPSSSLTWCSERVCWTLVVDSPTNPPSSKLSVVYETTCLVHSSHTKYYPLHTMQS